MLLVGCNGSKVPPAAAPAASAPPFHTTLTTKQLMTWIIDPNGVVRARIITQVTAEGLGALINELRGPAQ